MRTPAKSRRTKITTVAIAALISFGGISTVAFPAHADGIFAQLLPQLLYGSRGDDYDHRDEHWSRSREREHPRRYYRHEENRRWRENRDEGDVYRHRHRDGDAYRHYDRGE